MNEEELIKELDQLTATANPQLLKDIENILVASSSLEGLQEAIKAIFANGGHPDSVLHALAYTFLRTYQEIDQRLTNEQISFWLANLPDLTRKVLNALMTHLMAKRLLQDNKLKKFSAQYQEWKGILNKTYPHIKNMDLATQKELAIAYAAIFQGFIKTLHEQGADYYLLLGIVLNVWIQTMMYTNAPEPTLYYIASQHWKDIFAPMLKDITTYILAA